MSERNNTAPEGAAETADGATRYIAALTLELAQMARRHGLNTLGYLLEMVRLEAEETLKS